MRHNLPADLPEAALHYIDALPKGRLVGFPMTGLDRTGVPAWKVALFLDEAGGYPNAMPSGFGYGATDGEAIVGALGEIAEMIFPTLALMERPLRTGSYNALARDVGARHVADPLTLCLPAGSPVDRDTALAWTQATRARTGETVLVPLDVAACDIFELPNGYEPFTTLITNGLGAGPDADWAVGHGLLECLQRDGNGLLFRALDAGVVLDLPGDLPPAVKDLLSRLDAAGIAVLPKFATDEFGLTNLYVVGHDRDGFEPAAPIMLSACGEACDPDRDHALRKALLEFCAARVRKAYSHGPLADAARVAPPGHIDAFLERALPSCEGIEDRALDAMVAWCGTDATTLRDYLAGSVFSQTARKPFGELPRTVCADARARGRFARGKMDEAGLDVLFIDCSPPGGGVAAVKVIVPGLEVETMSYYRIGERNTRKLIERDNPLIRFGAESETLRPVRLTQEALDRLGGRQPLLDTALVDRIVGPLYPLYREPETHHAPFVVAERAKQRQPEPA